MLGGLVTKALLLLFGYVAPAFECLKSVELRPGDIHQLRFWCQYWIIVAMVMALETFISWLPMYSEIKVAFFVYLWYPKTKGSDVIYDGFVRPIVMQYEPNIEQRLQYLRERSGQLLVFYVKNFTDRGTAFVLEVIRRVVSQAPGGSNQENDRRTGWSPFARRRPERRPEPSAPPLDPLFDDIDPAAVEATANALRNTFGAAPVAAQQRGNARRRY